MRNNLVCWSMMTLFLPLHIMPQMKALVEMENSGLVALLRDDKYEDLGRMYSLFKRVEGGLALVRTIMSDYIKETGKQLVQDPEKTKDPVEFVQKLLDERDKYEAIVTRSFNDDKTFRNALNQVRLIWWRVCAGHDAILKGTRPASAPWGPA